MGGTFRTWLTPSDALITCSLRAGWKSCSSPPGLRRWLPGHHQGEYRWGASIMARPTGYISAVSMKLTPASWTE